LQRVELNNRLVACQKQTARFKQGDHRIINPFYKDDQPFFVIL